MLLDELRRAPAGAISFARFMEIALYTPEVGYYARPDRPIGRAGDFYTSVSVGPVFGFLLAHRIASWCSGWEAVTLLEAGAHDGRLAADVLAALESFHPVVFARVRYRILEPLAARAAQQARTLERWASRVEWVPNWEAVAAPVFGVMLSNELLDAFPLRRFVWAAAGSRWWELGVGLDPGVTESPTFAWRRLAPDERALAELPAAVRFPEPALAAAIPDGFITETCSAAAAWWQTAASRLARGWLVACDYGFDAPGVLRPSHPEGTLRAYREHRLIPEALANPGAQDLTAHVDFPALAVVGEAAGLRTERCGPQGRWLGEIAAEVVRGGGPAADWLTARARQLQTLIHPTHLGQAMKAFVQVR